MKKIFKFIGVFILVLALTGCITKKERELTPLEVFKKAIQEKNDSGKVMVGVNLGFSSSGVKVDLPLTLNIMFNSIDENNLIAKINIEDNIYFGPQELYLNMKNNTNTVYMQSSIVDSMLGIENEENYWIKQEETEENEYSKNIEEAEKLTKTLVDEVLKETDIVLVNKENDIAEYQLNITKDLLSRILNAVGENTGDIKFDGNIAIKIFIDTKNNHITKMSANIGEIIKYLNLENDKTEMLNIDGIDKLDITIEFDYTKVNVEIPSEVTSRAITAEEYAMKLVPSTIG
ncbi:unknown [Clostridium sp. CAG:762]|nr:unknown [Clostridium sp. CAG:762]